jgi:hypothetical protein
VVAVGLDKEDEMRQEERKISFPLFFALVFWRQAEERAASRLIMRAHLRAVRK